MGYLPFSTRAQGWEPKALELRRLAGVGPTDLLDPWKLAPKLGLAVLDINDAINNLNSDERNHLLGLGRKSWSGGVYPKPLPNGDHLCILNPTHSPRRNKITLMEEISHIHLKHIPSALKPISDGIKVRDYHVTQEQDAYGVGAAALLPWRTFFLAVNAGRTIEELAENYEVTTSLIEYRLKITAAFRVYQARQRKGGRKGA